MRQHPDEIIRHIAHLAGSGNALSTTSPPPDCPKWSTLDRTIAMTGLSYLLGSVPFSYLVARARGVDLRQVGSGNIGSSNVWRSCGFKPFLAALTCDLLKGAGLPYLAARKYRLPPIAVILVGTGAMLGHTFPLFMRFKGGKAVATGAGVLLVIFPEALLLGASVWGGMLALTRISSVSSLSAVGVVAATTLLRLHQQKISPVYAGFILAASAGIVYLHRSNIKRLVEGRENRFQKLL